MPRSFDYLVDSDAFVALFLPDDALAPTVHLLFTEIEKRHQRIATTNWVVAETATVLSNKDIHARGCTLSCVNGMPQGYKSA